jgi:catechol 2,3-dioxygenase-like lactoylglutathione lyase family enzyme
MYDHLGIVTSDITTSRESYVACLSTLGISLLQDHSTPEGGGWLVFGTTPNAPFFVVGKGRPSFWKDSSSPSKSPIHVAFSSPSKSAVDKFHSEGLEKGGIDNGLPGQRQPDYYAAYLIDPDGNNVEAGYRE